MKSDDGDHADRQGDLLVSHRVLRRSTVLELTGVSAATLYRWIGDGHFPRPVQLGPNAVGWRWKDVREWLDSREPAGGGASNEPGAD